jgi:hypothetical protein
MVEEFESALQAAAKRAIQARPARTDDDTSDVLVAGEGFFYLGAEASGEIFKFETTPEGAPKRVVIDADSFLSGLLPTGMGMLAVREPDGLIFKINTADFEAETL